MNLIHRLRIGDGVERMKADKLLQLYQQGERNFRGLDLKGRSFRGKDLSGADFSKADIRGADFTNARLRNTNFSHSKAGLQQQYALLFGVAFILAAALLGSLAGLVDRVAELNFHRSSLVFLIPKWLTLGVLIAFAVVAIRNGIAASFSVFILAFVVSGLVALASPAAVIAAGAIAIAITVASFAATAIAFLSIATTTTTLACNVPMSIGVLVAFGIPLILVAMPDAGESAIGLTIIVITLSAIISWRALRGDRNHAPILRTSSRLLIRWGTCFWGADLTNADFTAAELKNSDFNEAILTSVLWENGVKTEAGGSPTLIFNQ